MSENVIGISLYLEGRRHNSKLLKKIGTALSPLIVKFNDSNDREIKAEWSMSAKYQTGTLSIEMEDGDDLSSNARDFIEGELSDELLEWFEYYFDEDDVRDSYASLSVGF